MDYLVDKQKDIIWVKEDESRETREMADEIDYWKSPDISGYIIESTPLGKFVRWASDLRRHQTFYGYIDGKLVATVVTSSASCLQEEPYLHMHVYNEKSGKKSCCDVLRLSTAERILAYNNEANNDKIEYLVVNPEYQNRGYGTRVVMSIRDNLDYFAPNSTHNSLSSSVHLNNKPSIKVFERSGFKGLNIGTVNYKVMKDMFLEDYFMEES